MSDNNNFDDIEFLNIDDNNVSEQAPPVPEYSSADELGNEYEAPVRKVKKSSMSRAEKRRRRRRKLLIRRAIFCVALVAFIVSATMLIQAFLDYGKADKIYKNIENSVFTNTIPDTTKSDATSGANGETATESVLLTNYDHAALLALNPDSVGYLQVPALGILLPVVQGDDNEYYLYHTLTGEDSKNGTLFIDSRNTEGIESQNAIIYGHNMKNGSMFGSLNKYIKEDFFSTGDNKYFYFYTENKIYKYEIYSVHTTPAVSETYSTAFSGKDAFFTYIDAMLRASYHKSDAEFKENSKTITFSTCTNDDNTRLVVQAVRIEELLQ